jgi:hypothetical protein
MVKPTTHLVDWHRGDNGVNAIYSIHFDPHGKGRFATAGGDNNVRVSESRPGKVSNREETRADSLVAVEAGTKWRGSKSGLSLNVDQAYSSCQRRSICSSR